ncbi:nitrogen permease regulator of amino acid transport activity 3-domain-containing protein [Lentinula edodes]|uniref:nitrogen permease regulator of amino acid transport activity 3-domain-containing protein n=1 Tax=Lentinula edodes TaxID=5353 RepID=UPI001E8E1C96|nr:nitrogen permease regulator of amino acid transport activity 3-domain-containing protein [Lentinula edodes]KAH7880146.1 nitrogen permease regulator of amino acid transport activity 3-domain-containing protein [Lentinula edodes]
MAETLLAILLVNSSAKGSTLVYHWPPDPVVPPRLRRALPMDLTASQSISQSHIQQEDIDPSYRWERTNSSNRDRSLSYTHSPSSGRTTPAQNDIDELEDREVRNKDKYENVFGYASEFLASILCPSTSMCHQKFQLTVDDLAFIGHPVCADWDGVWRFNSGRAKTTSSSRGGNSRDRGGAESGSPSPANRSLSLDKKNSGQEMSNSAGPSTKCTWLHTFNFVLVLDLPDPSSSASGNLSKYFDILYDQIGFIVAAVLFQEQVLSNFVEQECDLLGSLKDDCIRKSEPYPQYFEQALGISSVASAMKTLYDAIKSSSVAYLSIHDLPLELQLPPHLDDLLHNEEDSELDTSHLDTNANYSEAEEFWGTEMSFGWQLPALAPWKSLLLLDEIDSEQGQEAFANLRSPYITPEDRPVVEGLMRFLDTVNVTLSLADLASLLDWDLETQVFPTVRWLVLHRKAKIVDIINLNLKTVFTLSTKFDRPLLELAADFDKAFLSSSNSPSSPVLSPHTSSSHPSRASQSDFPQHPLPLPEILSIISTSSAKQTGGNHFFGSVLESRKDLIPLYHQVVSWMLKHDLIIVLHLRIRVVATPEVKALVKAQKGNANARKVQRLDRKKKRKEKTDSDSNNERIIERGRERKRSTPALTTLNSSSFTTAESGLGLEIGASPISTPEQNQYDNDNKKAFAWLSMSPKSARKHSQNSQPTRAVSATRSTSTRVPSSDSVHSNHSGQSKLSELILDETDEDEGCGRDEGPDASDGDGRRMSQDIEEEGEDDDEADDENEEETEVDAETDTGSHNVDVPSMIKDPGRATSLQRRWLNAMSLGKDQILTRRFELTNQYFDGKTTDDEILYRAEITRKQLREVLHHYEEFLQTFLHPS